MREQLEALRERVDGAMQRRRFGTQPLPRRIQKFKSDGRSPPQEARSGEAGTCGDCDPIACPWRCGTDGGV